MLYISPIPWVVWYVDKKTNEIEGHFVNTKTKETISKTYKDMLEVMMTLTDLLKMGYKKGYEPNYNFIYPNGDIVEL
jgi:hypothetical protein